MLAAGGSWGVPLVVVLPKVRAARAATAEAPVPGGDNGLAREGQAALPVEVRSSEGLGVTAP